MTRNILLAGNDSALSRAIEYEIVSQVEQYAVALIPNRLSGAQKTTAFANAKRISLDWNPSSPISARTLVLAAENRLDKIDDAILVCSPPSCCTTTADLPLSDVEIMVNDHIKSWFYLVRELAVVFTSRLHGNLILVYPEIIPGGGRDDAADILGPAALASFRAFTSSLLAAAHNEKYITTGFSTSDTGNEAAFAAYICKNINEINKRSCGKLHKFGKFSFFK